MKTESYSTTYTIPDRNNSIDANNSIFQVKRKIQTDYQENLVLKRINQEQITDIKYLESLLKSKIVNIFSPLDIYRNQGRKKNELVVIYRDFELYKLSQQVVSQLHIDTLKKMILQLAITMSELTRRKLYWPLFSVEQLYLINDCVCITSLDLNQQHYNLKQDNLQAFKAFVIKFIAITQPELQQTVDGNSFEEIIQLNLLLQGYQDQINPLDKLPKYHTMLQLFFEMNNVINQTVGFLEPHHVQFDTPDLFQIVYPGATKKVVYKAIQLEQADRQQLLINQEREIQITEQLDGCRSLAVGFCYLRIFDQAFFFMNNYYMSLEQGFEQMQKRQLSVHDNKKLVYKICWQISQGLDKMHSQNIMHRNINPSNIHMDDVDILKANFCIAEFDKSKQQSQSISKSIILQAATQANCNATHGYIPPDDPESYSIKTDLFQFGVVALQIANKGQYFGKGVYGLSVDEFEEKYGKHSISKQLKNFEYDERFIDYISKCIQIKPMQRPNTEDLHKTLYQVYLSSKIQIISKEPIMQQLQY